MARPAHVTPLTYRVSNRAFRYIRFGFPWLLRLSNCCLTARPLLPLGARPLVHQRRAGLSSSVGLLWTADASRVNLLRAETLFADNHHDPCAPVDPARPLSPGSRNPMQLMHFLEPHSRATHSETQSLAKHRPYRHCGAASGFSTTNDRRPPAKCRILGCALEHVPHHLTSSSIPALACRDVSSRAISLDRRVTRLSTSVRAGHARRRR